jgi:hypothetical protein
MLFEAGLVKRTKTTRSGVRTGTGKGRRRFVALFGRLAQAINTADFPWHCRPSCGRPSERIDVNVAHRAESAAARVPHCWQTVLA